MKKILYILFSVLTLVLFSGCDVIGENDRLTEVDSTTADKNVLIVEFTDQNCVNCPAAAEYINRLLDNYEGNLIAVTMHASTSTRHSLITDDGNRYEDYFKTFNHPSALIDGDFMSSDQGTWGGKIAEYLVSETPADIQLSTSYDAETRQLTITTDLTAINSLSLNYQLWLTESNIVDYQMTPNSDTWQLDYIHNHVFRAAVNGLWGEGVVLEAEEEKTLTHTFTLDNNWEPENMHIIGFVFENESKKVLQVNEIKLIN